MAQSQFEVVGKLPTTLTALLSGRAQHQPTDLAFGFLGDGKHVKQRLTYAELDRAARRIAGLLRADHVRGEPVLLLYAPSLDYVAAFFGCLYAGAIAVPAYPPHRNRSLDRLSGIVRDSGARVVLCSEAVKNSIGRSASEHSEDLKALHWLATDGIDDSITPYFEDSARPDTLAFLQYTS